MRIFKEKVGRIKNLNINVSSSSSNLQRGTNTGNMTGGFNDSRNSSIKGKQTSKSKPRININK